MQETVVEESVSPPRPSFMKPKKAFDRTPVLRKWSYSAWSLFVEVPYILYAQEILGKRRGSGSAANRGTEMHAELETYVLTGRAGGKPDLIGRAFLDKLYDEGYYIQPEKRFTLNADWKEVPEEEKAMTAILDVLATDKHGDVLIGDYKTGKRYDVKHTQQARLYAAVVNQVLGVNECRARFIYLDGHEELSIDFDKRTIKMAVDFWKEQGERMLTAHKELFAPPDSLAGIPKYYHEFLCDPDNYDAEHFQLPWYAKY
jgi:hypothetical protein